MNRRLARRFSLFDVMLDRLDDHDGVIDDDTDRQHEAEQRERIQAEAAHRHRGKRPDDGDGHGDQRNHGRSPPLQEDQDHGRHENDRIAQCHEHLVDRLLHERRRVVCDGVFHSLRKPGLQLVHLGPHLLGGFQSIGTGELIDRQGDGRTLVERADLIVVERPEFDSGHVAQPDHTTGVIRPEHHVGELAVVGQTAQRGHRVLKDLIRRRGGLPNLTGRDLDVLLLDRPDHIGG